MRRITSTPEIRQVHVADLSRNFPMQISEISNLHTHHEHEHDDEEEGVHGVDHEFNHHHQDNNKKVNPSGGAENSSTEQTVAEDPDDYGFFTIDDEDEGYNSSTPFQEGSDGEQAEKNRFKKLREQEQHALLEDKNTEALAAAKRRSSGNNGKKSSLRRGSAYGKKEEGIPLDFERREYNRVLPKPDILSKAIVGGSGTSGGGMKKSTSRGLFRVSSEPVFVRPVYLENDAEEEEQPIAATTNSANEDEIERLSMNSSSSAFVEGAMKRRISFGTIQIREHSRTMGDNPSCTYGTPIQLDWDYEELEDIKVEDYEIFRPSTRSKQQFHLNHFQRRNLLKLNGFSSVDISKTKKQVSKMRNQRERTKFLALNYPALNAVEDAIESGARKVKRAVLKASKNNKGNGSGSGTENNTVIGTSSRTANSDQPLI
jgi:hypothetical protein